MSEVLRVECDGYDPHTVRGRARATFLRGLDRRMTPLEQLKAIDTADGHETLIRMQWQDFAAYAWRKYQTLGRGAIIVDLKRAEEEGVSFGKVPTYYVAETDSKLAERGGWPNAEISELIREYDPEQDVVFLFVRLDGDVFHYNVTDEVTPRSTAGS